MKRGVFFLIFISVALGFFYSPIEKVVGQSHECFASGGGELVSASENPGERSASFVYENIVTDEWKFQVYSNKADVLVKKISQDGNLFTQPLFGEEVAASTESCKYFTVDFAREASSVAFEIPLEREVDDGSGKKCVYSIPENVINRLNALGGRAVNDISQICPDLQSGRNADGDSCSFTANCVVQVQQGETKKYGYKLAIDSCGQRKIYTDKNGEPLLDSEILDRAQQFVTECSTQTSYNGKADNDLANCVNFRRFVRRYSITQDWDRCVYDNPETPISSITNAGYYCQEENSQSAVWTLVEKDGPCPTTPFCFNPSNCREGISQPDTTQMQPQRKPECGSVGITDLKYYKIVKPAAGCSGPTEEWVYVNEGDSFPAGEQIVFKVNTNPSNSAGGCEIARGGALVDCNLNPNPGSGPLVQNSGNDLCRTVWTPDTSYFDEETNVALEYSAWCIEDQVGTNTGQKITNIRICPEDNPTCEDLCKDPIPTQQQITDAENSVLVQRLYDQADMDLISSFLRQGQGRLLSANNDLISNMASQLNSFNILISEYQSRKNRFERDDTLETCDCEDMLTLARGYMARSYFKSYISLMTGINTYGPASSDLQEAAIIYDLILNKCKPYNNDDYSGKQKVLSQVYTDLSVQNFDNPYLALQNTYNALEKDSTNQLARQIQLRHVGSTFKIIRLRADDDINQMRMYYKDIIRPTETNWGIIKGFFLDGPHNYAFKHVQGVIAEGDFFRYAENANALHEATKMVENYVQSEGDFNQVCSEVLGGGISDTLGEAIYQKWKSHGGEVRSFNDLMLNDFSIEDAFNFYSSTYLLDRSETHIYSPSRFFREFSNNPDVRNLCKIVKTGNGVSSDFAFKTEGYYFNGLPNWYTPYHNILGQAFNPTNYFAGFAGARIMGKVLPQSCRAFAGQSWVYQVVAENGAATAIAESTAGLPEPFNWIGQLSSSLVSFGPGGRAGKEAAALNFDSEYRRLLSFAESDVERIDLIMKDSELSFHNFGSSQDFVNRLNAKYDLGITKEEFEQSVRNSVEEFRVTKELKCDKPIEGVNIRNRNIISQTLEQTCDSSYSWCANSPTNVRILQVRDPEFQFANVEIANNLGTQEVIDNMFVRHIDIEGPRRYTEVQILVNPEKNAVWIWSTPAEASNEVIYSYDKNILEAAHAELNGLSLSDVSLDNPETRRAVIPEYFAFNLKQYDDDLAITAQRLGEIEFIRMNEQIITSEDSFLKSLTMVNKLITKGTSVSGGSLDTIDVENSLDSLKIKFFD